MAKFARQLDCVLIKPAGPDCNMACRYCFYLPKHRLFSDTPVHRMSNDILERTVQQLMQHGGPNVVFAWQGGEPTLMGVEFFERAVELQRRLGCSGQTVGNGLQTNGLLVDDRWCRFLHEARFLVGLSIDGPEPVHDHYRVRRGGQPTWEQVVSAARCMLKAGVEVNALAVVNDISARHPRETYAFLKDLGLRHMQFIPCLERDPQAPNIPAPFSVSPTQFGKFLCEVFDCWINDFEDGQPTTFIRWFDSVFATYVDVPPPECTLMAECGSYLVVEHNGDVFSCDFYVEPGWKLGNVLGDNLVDLLNSPQQARFGRRKAELARTCHECRWLTHCRGGCPKERLGVAPAVQPSHLCEAYQTFFQHADGRLRALADDWRRAQRSPVAAPGFTSRVPAAGARPGRNDPCHCGSGRKYKRCCGASASLTDSR